MRYIVGIDLGTTNTSVSYVDLSTNFRGFKTFNIPQLVKQGYIESLAILPSFCYVVDVNDFPTGVLDLPWRKEKNYAVGTFALEHGSLTPTGLISSAKSWLCHKSMNQKDAILPIDCRDEKLRISPVEASRRYLDHIRQAWNYEIAKGNPELELEQQNIILTVPASFNEVARSLTAEAAKLAGFESITFLEEPQAAFYHWISQNETDWHALFKDGDMILVCDVGGGTTDFSMIRFTLKGEIPTFERMAVGDHLLLGGDNIDTALAYYIENEYLKDQELSIVDWKRIYHEARKAKESLLSEKTDCYRVILQGKGSGVVKGTLSIELEREKITKFLNDGFFPILPWEEAKKIKKTSGLRSMGLAYEDDPCITKQLAHFLEGSKCPPPNFLLFNGGTMTAPSFQNAIKNSLNLWFPENTLQVISVKNIELAVSRGATYYGKARQGEGVRISSGSPRNFYLEFSEDGREKRALCLISRGAEEGTIYRPHHIFSAKANQPVTFNLYASHTRIADLPGEIISINPEELHQLPPIVTVLHFGKKIDQIVDVCLNIEYTPLGTLQILLESLSTDHRWNLEFQLKSVAGQDNQLSLINKGLSDQTFDVKLLETGKKVIDSYFSNQITTKPFKMIQELETIFDLKKEEWSPSILRGIAAHLLLYSPQKNTSSDWEAKWWNLMGYSLRPGFGYPLDDYKIKELWRIILRDLKVVKAEECIIQQLIFFRRISGGLNKGQQTQLYHQIIPSIVDKKSKIIDFKGSREKYRYQESIRTLASFERIDRGAKITLGRAILAQIKSGKGENADFWALGRIGARELMYGAPSHVIPPEECVNWIKQLLEVKERYSLVKMQFPLIQLVRKVCCKELEVDETIRKQVIDLYCSTAQIKEKENNQHIKRLIEGMDVVDHSDRETIFGDNLPIGLNLKPDMSREDGIT